VQAGLWEVDQQGVVGGIEKFKEADTDDGFYKYQPNVKCRLVARQLRSYTMSHPLAGHCS
jgi:hypothetical protein